MLSDFSYYMPTQNGMLKKVYCNRLCHACSVTKAKVESRQIWKYVNKLCFLSDASFQWPCVIEFRCVHICNFAKNKHFLFNLLIHFMCDKFEKFGGQIDM